MPLYEFVCDCCGFQTEKILPSYTSADPGCPWCQDHRGITRVLTRKIGAPSARFVGSGFYGTDYRAPTFSPPVTPAPGSQGTVSATTASGTKLRAPEAPKRRNGVQGRRIPG